MLASDATSKKLEKKEGRQKTLIFKGLL